MKKILKKMTCVTLIISMTIMMTGCGGRQAYPVQVSQVGDNRLNCEQLENEIGRIKFEVQNKSGQKAKGDNKDAALFGVGMLLFWPSLFFMDLSNADKVELEALQNRGNHLSSIYNGKGCN